MIEEIKAVARRHLAVEGTNLSLRAVARELSMVSSAVYRYFGSRDELLTALIIDAYDSLGAATEQAEVVMPRRDLTGRWLAVCHAVRGWARANPHEYALLYGSPVPGYAAPPDTIGPATRPSAVLGGILRDGVATGLLHSQPGERLPRVLRADLKRITADPRFAGVPEPVMARGMIAWIQLFGAVSFEMFGRMHQVVAETDAFFEYQMRTMATQLGL
jgi:AcrR family transcriptional regulator